MAALQFAAEKHRDQRRKDIYALPYINHPIALATVLCNEADITDPEVIAASLLHDTIEDTDTTAEELERLFGKKISEVVLEVSDDKRLKKSERKRLQIDRAAFLSYEAKLVKLADKICNLRDMDACPPANWDLERRREYFDWAKAVIDRMRETHSALEKIFDEAYSKRP